MQMCVKELGKKLVGEGSKWISRIGNPLSYWSL